MFDWHLWEGTKNWTLSMMQVLQNYDKIQRPVCPPNDMAENTFLWAAGLKVVQVKSVTCCHLFIAASWGTAQPSKSAVWIKVLVRIRLVLQGSTMFLTRVEGTITTPKILFICDWGDGLFLKVTGRQHSSLAATSHWFIFPPAREASTNRQQRIALAATQYTPTVVWSITLWLSW